MNNNVFCVFLLLKYLIMNHLLNKFLKDNVHIQYLQLLELAQSKMVATAN